MIRESSQYKLYVQDIKKVYKMIRKNRPPVPKFDEEDFKL